MAKMYGKGKKIVGNIAAIESEEQQRLRWQVELEFVQCLANPQYLNFLAQRGYFKEQAFVNYLKYLQYWKEPEYAKYIMYPICLYFLDLLQYEHFRREIVNSQCCKFIDEQIMLLWQHYTRKRMKLFSTVNGKRNPADAANSEVRQPGANVTSLPNGVANNGQGGPQQQQQQLPQMQSQSQGTSQQQFNGGSVSGSGSHMPKMQ